MILRSIRSSKHFVVFVSATAIFVDSLSYSMIIPLLPLYQTDLHLSDLDIGILMGVFAFFQIFGSMLFGWLLDKYTEHSRHTLFLGLMALAVTTFIFQLATAYWMLLIARCLQGVAAAASWSAAMTLIPRNLDDNERGRATSIIMSAAGVGSFIGPVLSGLLVSAGNRSTPYYFLTVMIVLDAGARLLLIEKPFVAPAGSVKLSLIKGYKVLVTDVEFMNFSNSFIFMGVEPLLPLFITYQFHSNALEVGLVYSSFSVMFVLGSVFAGRLVDSRVEKRPLMVTLGFLLGSTILALCPIATRIWVVVIVCVVSGFTTAFFSTAILPMMNSLIERKYGGTLFASANALSNVVWSFGSFVGPIFFAEVLQESSYSIAFMVSGILGSAFALTYALVTFNDRIRNLYSTEKKSNSATIANIDKTNADDGLLHNLQVSELEEGIVDDDAVPKKIEIN